MPLDTTHRTTVADVTITCADTPYLIRDPHGVLKILVHALAKRLSPLFEIVRRYISLLQVVGDRYSTG